MTTVKPETKPIYKANARNYERMGMMIDRLCFDKVKQEILGAVGI